VCVLPGTALVTLEDQLLWTDGRYFLEAADQLDCNWFLMKSGQPGVLTLTEWVLENLQRGQKIGANAKVISTGKATMYSITLYRS